jgi:hypothetical protein
LTDRVLGASLGCVLHFHLTKGQQTKIDRVKRHDDQYRREHSEFNQSRA